MAQSALTKENQSEEMRLSQHLMDLCLLNARILEFKTIGFRNGEVICSNQDGQIYGFIDHKMVVSCLETATRTFIADLTQSTNLHEVSRACALFWMRFISIHPFTDGNGRTGHSYISSQLAKHGWVLSGSHYRQLTIGHLSPEETHRHLSWLFFISIEQRT